MKDNKQVTLNEAIERETGEPTPPNTIPIPVEVTTVQHQTRPGYHSLYVEVSDEFYERLEKTADGRNINVWLSRLIERGTFHELP